MLQSRHTLDINPSDPNAGWWWRHSKYEIRDGCIRPGSRAKLERYDPWERYHAARREEHQGEHGKLVMLPAYQSLLDLIEKAHRAGPTALFKPTSEVESDIASWCAQHGLLGILLHRTRSVTLAARWRGDDPHSSKPGYLLLPVARRFVRLPDAWESKEVHLFDGGQKYRLDENPNLEGQLVSAGDLREQSPDGYVEILPHTDSFDWQHEPLSKTWATYFPHVPTQDRETHQYPQPLTDGFWAAYAEPIGDFISAAVTLADTIQGLALLRQNPPSKLTGNQSLAWQRAHYEMAALVNQVSAYPWIPDPKSGSIRLIWASPSLLASFAMMAFQDLAEGKVLACAHCGRVFVSDAWQAAYCSDKCRNTAVKRRYRAKKQKAEERGLKTTRKPRRGERNAKKKTRTKRG